MAGRRSCFAECREKNVIDHNYKIWNEAKELEDLPDKIYINLKEKFGDDIKRIKKNIFEKLPLGKTLNDKLDDIAIFLFMKFPEGVVCSNISGIVISGFGKDEIFPSLKSFEIEGLIQNYFKAGLNQHFMRTYFKEVKDEQKEK